MNVLVGKLIEDESGILEIFTDSRETFRLNFEERPDLKPQQVMLGRRICVKGDSLKPGWFRVQELEILPIP